MPQSYADDLLTYFTDVENLRDLFKVYLAAPELPKRILVIHGVGGIGKSSLLRMFRLHCKSVKTPVALASGDEAKSVVAVLGDWADDLKADGVTLPAFAKTRQHHRAIQAKAEDKAQESRKKMGDLAGKTAGKIAETAASVAVGAAIGSFVPVIGPIAGALGGMGAEALVDWLRGQGFAKADIDLLLDPAKKLTDDFLADIERVAPKRRLVLMLDTFEQLSALEDWARDLAQRLHPNVLLVIAGRATPNWGRAWSGWLAQAHIEELKPMTDDVMRDLVRRYYATMCGGEPDPRQVEAIISFARGLPMVVTSAVQLWVEHGVKDFDAVKAEVVADLVDRLKEGVPAEMTPVLEAAATVRWFNKNVLCAVTGQADVNQAYDELRRFPFVRSRVEGLALHDAVREIMDEYLHVHDPERHRELHERAAAYFETQLEKPEVKNWERLLLEQVHHRLRVDLQSGVELCVLAIEEATRLCALTFGNSLLLELSKIGIEKDTFPEVHFARGLLCLGLNDFEGATSELREALASQVIPAKLRFRATERLAYTLTLQGRLEEALRFYEECVGVSTQAQQPLWQINAWNGIETVLRRLGHLSRTIEVLHKSIDTCESIGMENSFEMAWAQDSLGIVLGIAGVWAQAISHHQRALDIYEGLGNRYNVAIVLHNQTTIKRKQGSLPNQVISEFRKALSTFEELGDERWIQYCNSSIAETLIEDGCYNEAKTYLGAEDTGDTSVKIWRYRLRGDIEQYTGQRSEAFSNYRKALSLAEHQKRGYEQAGFLVRLAYLMLQGGATESSSDFLTNAEGILEQRPYNDHFASLRLVQGHVAWESRISRWGNDFDAVFRYYQHALIYALRYNRFLLDETLSGRPQGTPLCPIIPHCLERGEEGRRMLIALRDWWQTGVNDIGTPRPDTISPILEGIPLLEAERIAREREPGDGSPQRTVLEQIDAALSR